MTRLAVLLFKGPELGTTSLDKVTLIDGGGGHYFVLEMSSGSNCPFWRRPRVGRSNVPIGMMERRTGRGWGLSRAANRMSASPVGFPAGPRASSPWPITSRIPWVVPLSDCSASIRLLASSEPYQALSGVSASLTLGFLLPHRFKRFTTSFCKLTALALQPRDPPLPRQLVPVFRPRRRRRQLSAAGPGRNIPPGRLNTLRIRLCIASVTPAGRSSASNRKQVLLSSLRCSRASAETMRF